MAPRFSVYIPVRNDGQWLPGAVDSVLAQTFADWDLVIGDNASDDDGPARLAGYTDPRIRYHRFSEIVPVAENWNRTMELTIGEWVIALSADDRLQPTCLARIAEVIDGAAGSGASLAAVQTACRRVDEDGEATSIIVEGGSRLHPIRYQPFRDGIYESSDWVLANAAPGVRPWMLGSQAVPRALFIEVGGWRPEMGLHSDIEFALRVAAYGPVAYISEPLLNYTVRLQSMTQQFVTENLVRGDSMVVISHAWTSALTAHAARRPVSRAERRAARRVVARAFLQRALRHRQSPYGRGHLGAAADVLAAVRSDIGTVAEPWRLVAALAAIFAPAWVISRATSVAHGRGWVMV